MQGRTGRSRPEQQQEDCEATLVGSRLPRVLPAFTSRAVSAPRQPPTPEAEGQQQRPVRAVVYSSRPKSKPLELAVATVERLVMLGIAGCLG